MPEEKGHTKNIANFEQMIAILTALGTTYNPSNELLTTTNLNTLLSRAKTSVADYNDVEAAATVAVNERAAAFEPLGRLVTRIGNAAAANITDQRFLEDLAAVTRKLQGRRAGKPADDPATPDIDESQQTVSASQMSFDNRIQHFAELVALLKTNSAYAPNETELQIAALEDRLNDLRTKNTAANTAQITAADHRTARNHILYNETDGLMTRVGLIKNYLKSILDADSPPYQQIKSLQFKKS